MKPSTTPPARPQRASVRKWKCCVGRGRGSAPAPCHPVWQMMTSNSSLLLSCRVAPLPLCLQVHYCVVVRVVKMVVRRCLNNICPSSGGNSAQELGSLLRQHGLEVTEGLLLRLWREGICQRPPSAKCQVPSRTSEKMPAVKLYRLQHPQHSQRGLIASSCDLDRNCVGPHSFT